MKLNYIYILLILALVSCDTEENQVYEVFADVFIETQIQGNDTVHAIVYSTLAYFPMKSVKGSTPSGEEVILVNNYEEELGYSKEPVAEDFSTEIPELGKYSFDIIFDNKDELSKGNSLSEKIVYPPTILGIEYNEEFEVVNISWANVEGADAYMLKIYSGGTQIFATHPEFSDPPQESYTIEIPREDFEQYVPGELVFEISSVLYENISDLNFLQALGGSSETLSIN
jgi:hypothetical protein